MTPARVGIDARRTTLWPETGIARYTRNLLEQMNAVAPSDMSIFAIDVRNASREGAMIPMGRGRPAPVRAFEEQVSMPRISASLDLLHLPWSEGPARPRCHMVTTLFDLAIVDRPDGYGFAFRNYYVRLVEQHIRRAARILVPSQTTLEAAERRWGRRPFRLVPLGVDRVYTSGSADERDPYPTVLYTGGYDPRKRVGDLIDAMDLVRRQIRDVRIVLSGSPPEALRRRLKSQLGEAAVLPGLVTDEDLAALYRRAWLVVYASDMEGFGFPLVEGFASGTPVIATRTGSIPEVAGEAAMLVAPADIGALAEAIQEVLTDDRRRDSMRAAGLVRAAHFNWRSTAEQTLDIYREVLL